MNIYVGMCISLPVGILDLHPCTTPYTHCFIIIDLCWGFRSSNIRLFKHTPPACARLWPRVLVDPNAHVRPHCTYILGGSNNFRSQSFTFLKWGLARDPKTKIKLLYV